MTSLDQEWLSYMCSYKSGKDPQVQPISTMLTCDTTDAKSVLPKVVSDTSICPHTEYELIISTKTKVLFLNQPIDIHSIFWEIPVIDYWMPIPGILKKQIKLVAKTPEEYQLYREKLKPLRYYKEQIIKQIDNPTARSIKFKDERKLTVGLAKKDILSYRIKLKNAFYNCFAVVMRFQLPKDQPKVDLKTESNIHIDDSPPPFREVHVKVFNTGKLEIPGIVDYRIMQVVKDMIMELLLPLVRTDKPIEFIENSHEDHVLINSNFNCGYYINRDRLYTILKNAPYYIDSSYDPCTYPGVKCKFYFNRELGFDPATQLGCIMHEDARMKMSELNDSKKYTEVSFMIFRTGSCLIVGNCTEKVLRFVFDFIKNLLIREYANICIFNEVPVAKKKKTGIRSQHVYFTNT